MNNVHIIYYGDDNFLNSRKRFKNEAINFGFKHIHEYNLNNLPKSFIDENGSFINDNKRGCGYWLWKSRIVLEVLDHMNNNDILLYADVGCTINVKGKNRFLEYVDMTNSNDILTFQMPHIERVWTKQNVAKYLNCQTDEIMNSGQIIGGIFMMKKTDFIKDFVNYWYSTCNLKWTIDDSPSEGELNHEDFREHRHDQSVFSLLVKKHNLFRINDETYSEDWTKATGIPIQATRKWG